MNVFTSLSKHPDSVMAIQYRSIQPNLQRTLLTGSKGEFQLTGREAAKMFQFSST
jgi:hypothetical protein